MCGESGAKFHSAADCSCGILVCGESGAKFHSAADCSCGILVCGKSGAKFHSAADCSCGILVCGKSGAKFHSAADLPQTGPAAYSLPHRHFTFLYLYSFLRPSIINCLSLAVRDSVLQQKEPPVDPECRSQLKFELLQRVSEGLVEVK